MPEEQAVALTLPGKATRILDLNEGMMGRMGIECTETRKMGRGVQRDLSMSYDTALVLLDDLEDRARGLLDQPREWKSYCRRMAVRVRHQLSQQGFRPPAYGRIGEEAHREERTA